MQVLRIKPGKRWNRRITNLDSFVMRLHDIDRPTRESVPAPAQWAHESPGLPGLPVRLHPY